ncbi:hypothetical protein [Vibrio rumoiensis]|uniref:Uncharacterized protein n=1 Tax=Vibrio rumoiensis 1S-45 TaxID=1188252 RepID=A0A1E5DZR2_9VIBR|nr:hypothetical protein [Vibrio rumoiensis]OEF23412.1 hypothetical protein A1QC_12110 [Vibrio rumoiensis 1S-45]
MATYLPKHKNKPAFTLSRNERYFFLLMTVLLSMGVLWHIHSTFTERQALKPLKQNQYQFNQACQLSINAHLPRDNAFCQHAQNFNDQLTLALKDQSLELSETIALNVYFQQYYREFSQ